VCACSTCHVILENSIYDSLDEASEEEEDMLDQAFGLTPTYVIIPCASSESLVVVVAVATYIEAMYDVFLVNQITTGLSSGSP